MRGKNFGGAVPSDAIVRDRPVEDSFLRAGYRQTQPVEIVCCGKRTHAFDRLPWKRPRLHCPPTHPAVFGLFG